MDIQEKEKSCGKRFEGISRFVTPVYKNNQKISLYFTCLDHKHVMQFTENLIQQHLKQNKIYQMPTWELCFLCGIMKEKVLLIQDTTQL